MSREGSIGNFIDQVLRECREQEEATPANAMSPSKVIQPNPSQEDIAKTWTWETLPKHQDPQGTETKATSSGLMGSYSSRLLAANPRYFAEKIFGKVS